MSATNTLERPTTTPRATRRAHHRPIRRDPHGRLTVTDLFCGAGGSSRGATLAGLLVVMAANHWRTAIDVHQVHHPDTGHDCADISQVDPRRYPWTNILIASPECTNHTAAKGVSRKAQQADLFNQDFDPVAERSRATMWDVVRFTEHHLYDAVVVENVVEATKWVLWQPWLQAMLALGYEHKVLSHNSMHHGVPQSRDRIYVVFWRTGLAPDLELELVGACARCEAVRPCRQAWKNGRTVGRYRQQYRWACTTCGTDVEPATQPASSIIDWTLPAPIIRDRARPLAESTMRRIAAGVEKWWPNAITTAGAGNVWERTPGMRAQPIDQPVPTQQTTATTAVATPPGFVQRHYTPRNNQAQMSTSSDAPMPTATTSGTHSLVQPPAFMVAPGHGGPEHRTAPVTGPHPTVCASDDRQGLVVHLRGTSDGHMASSSTPVATPVGTVSASGQHHALLMRNNTQRSGDGGEMSTPVSEPTRTMTTTGHQSLVLPYYGTAKGQPADRPAPTVTTADRCAIVEPVRVDPLDCGFRMLEPYEVAAAMAFPVGYIPRELTKKDQVKLAGNAVTPPVMQWITGRLLQCLEAAA